MRRLLKHNCWSQRVVSVAEDATQRRGRVAAIIQEWRAREERPWSYEKGMFVSSVGFPAPAVLDFRATEMTMTIISYTNRKKPTTKTAPTIIGGSGMACEIDLSNFWASPARYCSRPNRRVFRSL